MLKKIDNKVTFYFLVSVYIFLLWNYDAKYGFNPTDEARIFGYIQRISEGNIPHKDFIFPHLSGSAYLYYFFNFIESSAIFLQRFLGIINLMAYSYIFLVLTGKIFTKQNTLIKLFLLLLSFNINMHNFGLHIWPTTDGVLLSLIACLIIYRKEKYKYLGFMILGLVPLLKSGFLFSTVILFFYFTLKTKFNINQFIKSSIGFAVFPISYLFLVIYNSGFDEMWTELFKMPKFWSLWISSLGINDFTLVISTLVSCLPFFFVHKKFKYLDMRFLIIFSLLFLVSIESFLEIGPKPRYFLYSLFVFIAIFLLKNKVDNLNEFELPLLLCLMLGFSSTLSGGWAVSHWVSGSLIAICILLVFHLLGESSLIYDEFFNSSIKIFVIILIFYPPVIENLEVRSNYNYRDIGQNSNLNFNLNDINKYYGNVYTSENIYNYLSSIEECLSLIDSKNVSVYPDNPFIYLMYDLKNPLLIDRFEGYFVGSEYVNFRLTKNIDNLNSQTDIEFAVLLQTYPAMNIINIDKEKINLVNNRNESGFWDEGLKNIQFIKDNLSGDLSSCNSFEIISKNINFIDR